MYSLKLNSLNEGNASCHPMEAFIHLWESRPCIPLPYQVSIENKECKFGGIGQ